VADFLSRKSFNFFLVPKINVFSDEYLLAIFKLLTTNTIPPDFNHSAFMKHASLFCVSSNTLYRKSNNNIRKVLFSTEIVPILTSIHDNFGHFGIQSMFDFMKTRYWMPQLYAHVKNYVQSCFACQSFQTKYPSYKFNGKFGTSGIFDAIAIDFVGPLPTYDGFSYIITAVLPAIRYPFAKAVKTTTAKEAAIFLTQDVIPFIGCPKILISDEGSHFNNNLISLLCEYLKIKHQMIPAYTPEWNPFVERFNQTIQFSLFKMVYLSQQSTDNWIQFIPAVLFGYRVRICPDLKFSPYFLLFGIQPTLPIDLDSDSTSIVLPSLDSRLLELDPLLAIRLNLIRSSQSSDSHTTFNVGDFVWLLDPKLRKRSLKLAKFQPRYIGPYQISEVLSQHRYILKSQIDEFSKPIHASRIIPFVPRLLTSDFEGGVSRELSSRV
jgi:hypothetical protein